MDFKKLTCPICRKKLIRLEPFENRLYRFWCDDCDLDIEITENNLKEENTDEILGDD